MNDDEKLYSLGMLQTRTSKHSLNRRRIGAGILSTTPKRRRQPGRSSLSIRTTGASFRSRGDSKQMEFSTVQGMRSGMRVTYARYLSMKNTLGMRSCRRHIRSIRWKRKGSRTTALHQNTMWKAATKRSLIKMCSCGCRQKSRGEQIFLRTESGGFTVPDMHYPASYSADTAEIYTGG